MAGITLTIDVDDKGTVKVKQFADESKKAFKEMTDGPKQAQGPLASLQEGWIGITAKVAIATAAFYAAKRMIYDTAKEIASAGNNIERMSRTFNMSTDDLQKWSYTARMADVDIQGFGEAFRFLTRSMGEALQGSGDAAKAFSILGINLKDTTGKTKDQQTVMLEVIGSLEKYADGVNRDTLMLAVFGRGWLSVKPLIDQGTKAIEENKKEAERLNTILGKDTIRALSESEDAFKRWEMTWKVAKAETFQPMITIFTSMLERILALRTAFKEGGFKGMVQDILAAQEEQRINVLPPAAWTKEWVAGWKPPSKPEAPEVGAQKEIDIVKEVQAAIDGVIAAEELRGQIAIAQHELAEGGWSKEKDIVAQVREEIANLERETNEWGEVTVGRQELVEAGWEATAKAEADAIREGIENARLLHQGWLEEYTKVSEWGTIWESVGQNISSAWSSNMVNIIRSTESTSEKIKSFFQSIGDVFLSTVSKMIAQWLIFGSVTGKKESGGSWLTGSLWSGLLGALFHGGGIVPHEGGTRTVPAAAFAFAPKFHTGFMADEYPAVLKKGEGVFTPGQMKALGAEKKGGDTYVYFVNPIGFDQALMKNMGTILKGVAKDARMAGPMHSIMKGNG